MSLDPDRACRNRSRGATFSHVIKRVGAVLHFRQPARSTLGKRYGKGQFPAAQGDFISTPRGEAMATFLKGSSHSPASEAASRVLQEAGLGMVEVRDWADAAGQLEGGAGGV